MALNFEGEFVKFSYRLENRSEGQPTEEQLREWDQVLWNRYWHDGALVKQMISHKIPTDRRNRSIVAMLCVSSRGSGIERVEFACQYWANVMELPLEDGDPEVGQRQ